MSMVERMFGGGNGEETEIEVEWEMEREMEREMSRRVSCVEMETRIRGRTRMKVRKGPRPISLLIGLLGLSK